jgi:1,4-dihydroxy-2-naphthoate octaprenyltransferase
MRERVIPKPVAWLRVARLQFYPMVVFVYGAGAAAAAGPGGIDWARAILAYACLALIEFATVLTNEHFDYASDVVNRNAGPFTGGSRMLVEGALTHAEVIRAVAIAVAMLGVVSGFLLARSPVEVRIPLLVLIAAGAVLGLGYTAPPLKLSYRGLGEIDVAFTHSTYAILVGWVAQGGSPASQVPYLLGMPVFCAVLAANTLAGIPDHAADASAGKKSYSVIFGPAAAAVIAVVAAAAAATAGLLLWRDGIVSGWPGAAFVFGIPHAIGLAVLLVRFIRSGNHDRRIDSIMATALGFIMWFGLIPFVYFLWFAHGPS